MGLTRTCEVTMKFVRLLVLSFLMMIGATSAAASTILYGTQLSFYHEFLGTQYWAEDFTVGPGVEIAPGPNNPNRPRYYTIDIEEDRLTFEMGPYNFNPNFGFNGIVITDVLDNAPDFLSGSIVTNSFANSPGISVSENEIRIDFSAAGISNNQTVVIEFEIAPVPLPASASMLAIVVAGGFCFSRYKRRARA